MSEEARSRRSTRAAAARAAGTSAHTSLREYIESLLVTVILALFGTTFVVQAFKIPSQSMEPTLLVGDHLLVNKFIFGGRGHWYDSVCRIGRFGAATSSSSNFRIRTIRTT